MIPFRARLSAIAIVAAMLVTAAAPLLASGSAHRACLAHHHDCTKAARLSGCCEMDHGDRSNDATPANGKTHVAQPVADGTIIVAKATLAAPGLLRHVRALMISPCSPPPDLITLFGTFLI